MTEEKTTKKINRVRRKGDGGVQEYAPGKFRAFLDIGYENGKRKRKTFTGSSPTEVIKLLNKYKAEQLKGTLVADNKMTFEEYAKRWLEIKEKAVKTNTYESYEYICNYHVFPAFGKTKIQKLTTPNLNDYFNKKLKEGLSTASVVKHRATIHGILQFAVQEGVVSHNVCDKCMPITIRHKETRAMTPEEAQRLLETAREIYVKHKGHLNKFYQIFHVVLLALVTGLRRGEILALRWDCIDKDELTLTIKENLVEVKGGVKIDTPKTEKSKRVVAIGQDVVDYLYELDDGKSDYVFHTRTGGLMTLSNVNRAFRALLKEAKIEGIRFHDMRHTHATLLITNGLDFKAVSERLGHSDVRVTLNRYTHVIKETDRKAASLATGLLLKKQEPKENTSDPLIEEGQNESKTV